MWKILCVVLVFLAAPIWAATITFDVDVDEPTKQEPDAITGNTVLNDLALMRFVARRADGSPWITPIEVPATNVQGGGHHFLKIMVIGTDGADEPGTMEAEAVDTSGNASIPAVLPIRVDSVSPRVPNNFTVTTITTVP